MLVTNLKFKFQKKKKLQDAQLWQQFNEIPLSTHSKLLSFQTYIFKPKCFKTGNTTFPMIFSQGTTQKELLRK